MPTLKGYVDIWGKHAAGAIDHSGKASYVQGGDTLTAKAYGLRGIDYVGGGVSNSGTYSVQGKPIGLGSKVTYKLVWFVVATGVEVAAGVDLSAERVRIFAFGG